MFEGVTFDPRENMKEDDDADADADVVLLLLLLLLLFMLLLLFLLLLLLTHEDRHWGMSLHPEHNAKSSRRETMIAIDPSCAGSRKTAPGSDLMIAFASSSQLFRELCVLEDDDDAAVVVEYIRDDAKSKKFLLGFIVNLKQKKKLFLGENKKTKKH